VSVFEIGALLRRHFIAVLGVLVLVVWVVHDFKATPTVYGDGATVVLTPPASTRYPNPFESGGGSVVTAAGVIAAYVQGSEGQRLVSAAGGTMPYTAQLINSYNQDFPNYVSAEIDVEVTGTDIASITRTYQAVIQVLKAQVVARQMAAQVPKIDRIHTIVIGNPGPLAQAGSPKRSLGGLMVLTLAGIFAVAIFFERYPIRLRELGRSRRNARRPGYPATASRGASRA
jgi:hypothetical protein